MPLTMTRGNTEVAQLLNKVNPVRRYSEQSATFSKQYVYNEFVKHQIGMETTLTQLSQQPLEIPMLLLRPSRWDRPCHRLESSPMVI
jgi:hypothetical protein